MKRRPPIHTRTDTLVPDTTRIRSMNEIQPRVATRLAPLPTLIFWSRWMQVPLYLGLIVAQGVYVFLFLKELWHLIHDAGNLGEQQIMLIVLGLIDVVMISNLLVIVIVGGYETFVSRLGLERHPDQPEWQRHVHASVLQVKLAMTLLGIPEWKSVGEGKGVIGR